MSKNAKRLLTIHVRRLAFFVKLPNMFAIKCFRHFEIVLHCTFYNNESSRADWSRAMVCESKDHGNDVTCHALPVFCFAFGFS